MPRKPRRASLALTVSFGLLVTGCASQNTRTAAPVDTHQTNTPVTQAAQPAATSAARAPIEPDENVVQLDYTPHQWPDPDQDLWAAIRAGFALDSNAERRPVREWTQFYATHQGHLDASLDRAQPFLWHVVQQVEERGMPTELALLPIVESGFNPSARSYMGASGLWQFMPGTADHMGLPRDWWYDGRNDVIASTNAALNYLTLLKDRYDGDWLLALAAYNAGPGRVDAALARAQAEGLDDSYWNLELPRETTEYVPKLLAVRRIMMTPARFGVDWPALDNTPRTRSVKLPGQTELALAARMLDMPEDDLRRLNPGMRRWASAPDDDMSLLVPARKAAAFRQKLAATRTSRLVSRSTHTVRRGEILGRIAHHYGVSLASLRQANHLSGDRIRVGQTLQIPRSGVPGQAAPPAEPTQTYVVQSGDSLWDIAHRYHIDVATLRARNRRVSTTLHPGQSLIIPGSATPPEPSTYLVKRGDSLWSIAHANDVAIADLRRWNRLGRDTALQPGRSLAIDGPAPLPDYYEVESGDSLWSIAHRFSMQVATLRSLNDMSAGSTIRPGQRLRLQPAVSG
ncbi:lytic transglycosylase [Salinisphaera aquimarina]|uniref:LysM peptidoglycan-binding domain-containing protein n=1 Tax=Salinisphaera aquimarina TaxID=2094031 RepID=A0ABV7ETT6_9GAMM